MATNRHDWLRALDRSYGGFPCLRSWCPRPQSAHNDVLWVMDYNNPQLCTQNTNSGPLPGYTLLMLSHWHFREPDRLRPRPKRLAKTRSKFEVYSPYRLTAKTCICTLKLLISSERSTLNKLLLVGNALISLLSHPLEASNHVPVCSQRATSTSYWAACAVFSR